MDKKKLFDVWIRVRPFEKAKALPRTPKKLTIDRDPTKDHERAKSPNQLKIENDYRAMYTAGNDIVFNEKEDPVSKQGNKRARKAHHFPSIFNESQSNKFIFDSTIKPKLPKCLDNSSITFLTYGISGSGKTHTIFGSTRKSGFQEQGVLGFTVDYIFGLKEEAKKMENGSNLGMDISVSFMEIYNENVYNLLKDDRSQAKLAIIESPFSNGVVVPGLESFYINEKQELLELVKEATDKRVVSRNRNNQHSSRSHVMIEIKLVRQMGLGKDPKTAKICFVDLAGSEKVKS